MKAYRPAESTDDDLGPEVIRQARDLLSHSAYSELSWIISSYHRGVLMLQGRVSSRYIKQVAQELTGRIRGVHAVVNEIEVRPAWETGRERKGVETMISDHAATLGEPGGDDSSEKG